MQIRGPKSNFSFENCIFFSTFVAFWGPHVIPYFRFPVFAVFPRFPLFFHWFFVVVHRLFVKKTSKASLEIMEINKINIKNIVFDVESVALLSTPKISFSTSNTLFLTSEKFLGLRNGRFRA